MSTLRNLYSRSFSRKILIVFSIATFVPILSLTIFSNKFVSDAFETETHINLIKHAKSYGLLSYDKISRLDEQLSKISRQTDDFLLNSIISDFDSLELIPVKNISAAGFGNSQQPIFDHFRTKKNKLNFKFEKLHYSSNGDMYILRGTFQSQQLFGDENINPFSEPICVFTANRDLLFCSEDIALKNAALSNVSSLINSKERVLEHEFEGNNYLLASWELFLPTHFQSSTWYFVILKQQSLALAAIKHFGKVLIPIAALFFLIVAYFVSKITVRLLTPLRDLIDATKKISIGDYDINLTLNSNDEFQELSSSFMQMSSGLKHQFNKDQVFSNLEKSILATLDIHAALEASLPSLIELFETNWLVVALVNPDKPEYLDSHCVFSRQTKSGEYYKKLKHKRNVSISLNNYSHLIPRDKFKAAFYELSNVLNAPFIWVWEIKNDQRTIAYIFLDNANKKRLDENKVTALDELVEHLSIIYTTHEQRLALYNKANFDELTQLPNRNNLLEYLGNYWDRAKTDGTEFALLYIDLDHFKNVNDLSGHKTGNEVLILVAKRLRECIGTKGMLARLSGDEFCVMLAPLKSTLEAIDIAESITLQFKNPFTVNDMSYFLGTSIGIAIGPVESQSAEHILENADLAMYKAKQDGRNRFVVFDDSIEKERSHRLSLEHHLHYALECNEVSVNYQPKIDLNTGKLVSVESLARWNQRELGLVRTDEFIALAEESGLINEIGEWILRKACYQHMDWAAKGIQLESIAVNVSARQLASKRFNEIVASVIEETGIPPHCLDLEITESAFIHDEVFLTKELRQLHELGVHISIDDFGKEYSSLSYLKKIPFDTLKIDREFIMDLENDERDQSIVNVVINIGHTLGKKIVAEGIETIAQRDILRKQHCDIGQGYLFSQPLTDIEFLEFASQYIESGMDTKILAAQ